MRTLSTVRVESQVSTKREGALFGARGVFLVLRASATWRSVLDSSWDEQFCPASPPAFKFLWGSRQKTCPPGDRVCSLLCSRWVRSACESPATSLRPGSMDLVRSFDESTTPELQDKIRTFRGLTSHSCPSLSTSVSTEPSSG